MELDFWFREKDAISGYIRMDVDLGKKKSSKNPIPSSF
jgi:hypothetical protein